MPLPSGQAIGPYEIVSLIGAGGMGEVYRARDLRLGRDVAIKVLPEAFTLDPDRATRLKREAQLLASLNHPNIATIYGLEESAGVFALVMELVEGDTLRTPQPRSTALAYARQIAEALEFAHERGVVHRDLKPSNIKVTADGVVKLLDFGLAKAVDSQSGLSLDATHSPTLSLGVTTAGVIIGTAAYMSPEQATGKAADRRADIWAFGVVLYEMLTGTQAFQGESVSETLASVLKVDPDWQRLPPDTPASLRRLLGRCLTKDRTQRLQAIGDARLEIRDLIAGVDTDRAAPASTRRWNPVLLAASAIALAALVGGAGWYVGSHRRAPEREAILSIVPPGMTVRGGAVSPDGSSFVFFGGGPTTGAPRLFLRHLGDPDFKAIEGTEGGGVPFFSPDGHAVGYVAGGRMMQVSLDGGAPRLVTNAGGGCAAWGDNGIIYFCRGFGIGISSVPANGGEPRVVTRVDRDQGELWHGYPTPLPGGETLLFTVYSVDKSFDEGKIVALSLKTGEKRVLVDGADNFTYLPTGYLVYARRHDLFAVTLDATTLRPGQAVRLAGNVFNNPGRPTPATFSVSARGPLLYGVSGGGTGSLLEVFAPAGASGVRVPMDEFFSWPALSPDGKRVAYQAAPDAIWVLQLDSKQPTRLTFEAGEHETPVWSSDNSRIAYTASRRGVTRGVFVRAADGTGGEQRLFVADSHIHLTSWSGEYLLFEQTDVTTGWDVWSYHFGDTAPRRLLMGTADEQDASLSPNGRFLAYTSNESRQTEVWVEPFPQTGERHQVTTKGGLRPYWASDNELLYFDPRQLPMSVPVTAAGVPGMPRPLNPFPRDTSPEWATTPMRACDFGRGGVVCTSRGQTLTRFDVMLNWLTRLPR